MTVQKYLFTPAVAAVIALWSTTSLQAADTQVPAPVPAPAGPLTYSAPAGNCPTCGAAGASSTGCKSCGSTWFKKHDKGPYVVNLCPGACFGYFQTQWRKWDDVCPYPYQGIGVSDAPKPPAPALPGISKPAGTTLPLPQPEPKNPMPTDPKTGSPIKPMSGNFYPQVPAPFIGN